MKRYMSINDVKIKKVFKRTTPKVWKIDKAARYYIENQSQLAPIVLDQYGFLIDGYATYLALKELGIKEVWFKQYKQAESYKKIPTYYVFGIHKAGGEEFVWRVPHAMTDTITSNVLPGDRVLVATKFGSKQIIVTKIQLLDKPPIEEKIKRVIRKIK